MNKFQIDPKTQMVIMFIVVFITFLGTNSLPASVPPSVSQPIHDWSRLDRPALHRRRRSSHARVHQQQPRAARARRSPGR